MTSNVSVAISSVEQVLQQSRSHGTFESIASSTDPEDADFVAELEKSRRVAAAHMANVGTDVFDSLDDRMVSLLQTYMARVAATQVAGSRLEPLNNPAEGFEAKFDNRDPVWIWSLRDWVKGLRKHDFITAASGAERIGNDYRLALLSDWGTGRYGAPACAGSIARSKQSFDMVMHLGDVYYAGDVDEVEERFLAHWPDHPNAVNRALNGNHEMYTGGKGYFDGILADKRFKQPASYFAMHNDHWLLVALDTAYAEHDLFGEQTAWLMALAAAFSGHRILLFSHHQPFSAFESGGPKLAQKLAPLLSAGRIAAWYWGHEHSCVRYDLHPDWKLYGRCVGHSGFPYFRLVKGQDPKTRFVPFEAKGFTPSGRVLDGPNLYVNDGPERYGPNGYVTLELRGNAVHETYCEPDGSVLDEFELHA